MTWVRVFYLCVLLAATAPAAAQTVAPPFLPIHAVQLAWTDIQTVGVPYRPYVLYLWVPPHIADADLPMLWKVLSGQCNGMSQEPELVPLAIVPGSGGRLLRLSILDYRWPRKIVEEFGFLDPYFYATVIEDWQGGNGYAKGKYTVSAVAPWVAEGTGKTAATALLAAVQSPKAARQVPIISATLFVFQTFVSTNGSPNYNDFLGVKTENDFFRVTGVRADEEESFEANLFAVIAESGITYEPRSVEKREKIGGELWRTHDFAKATGDSNPFQNLGRSGKNLRAKADAHEDFAHLANGLWAVGLFNGQGAAQNNAPDTITTGDTTTTNPRDHRVHLPLSCFRCHVSGGLQDLDDWVRNLQRPPPFPPLSLQVGNAKDPQNLEPAIIEALRFRRQYGPSLLPSLARGRGRFAAAVAELTGMKVEEYAAAYGKTWNLLCEPRIDSAWAARDLGVTEDVLIQSLKREVKVAGGVSNVLASGFLKPRAEQRPIQLRQYLEMYPSLQKTLRGIVDAKVKP